VKELGLEDDTVLRGGKVEIREVPAGTYLMKEESHKVIKHFKYYFLSL
jgi:lysophospholipid hydrolase